MISKEVIGCWELSAGKRWVELLVGAAAERCSPGDKTCDRLSSLLVQQVDEQTGAYHSSGSDLASRAP